MSLAFKNCLRAGIPRRSFVLARFNSCAAPKTPSSPIQQLYDLREIDRLTTSVGKSSPTGVNHPSPLLMRALPAPWLSSSSPDLESQASKDDIPNHRCDDHEAAPLGPKHMSESFTSFDLPLASDAALFDRYVNTSGGFRMGKLLEHLDSLAGAVAYRHCLPPPENGASTAAAFHDASSKAGLYLATASADRLDMFGRLNKDNVRDLKFSGFVTWTGNSSMEVVVKMEGSRPDTADWETLMLGRFAMVCRDSKTHKSRKIPPLIVESEEEKILWAIGDEHQKRRKTRAMNALDKVPPSSEEARELHELMLKVQETKDGKINGQEIVQMKDTEIETVQLMHPQDRNLHGKVFGGILMRLAFELCFTNVSLFAQGPLRFLALDQITFRLPVPIGAVLRLSSKIVHTTQPHEGPDGEAKVHVMVKAEVEEVETGTRRETNTFFFTMAKGGRQPLGRTVVPTTYNDAMFYLEGKRRVQVGNEMRKLYLGERAGAVGDAN
ncbi:thioesterase family protein [Cryptococcus neoformans C23]|uniref:Thioesterase family protein n=2 Tax=Cryptococcus neoformans TaxID=5207 RepID=A0A854QEQ7_CRYNE|nr:thioesterase [Cryptococcus neoformans var. grubii H99]AUB23294.1 thioesterase family protein [Cryptococcus neoformans var. grubii]OWZ34299.1 thioesterase family protein [Cryptococcus neoformans var. grubii AD2-60a]OWZ46383.1 thioesterase family protein [Cryptococcus neoformans var. grubii C23]OWZ49626.1 thioesterase family protein [Cryptococcus neoformans var. grubii AD1-83a]OWZ55503.1 thioesterase family protein [Cryptococcus neoformans var. grubii 125.91]OXC85994.1 thioesterase family pr|eukprot:XP_012048252.1 thioesterase [Cryptococcus neoformans var. grubii H99]